MAGDRSRRAAAVVGALLALGIVAVSGWFVWRGLAEARKNPLSDDATIGADVARIAASIPGRVKAIHVRENDLVAKGDLLVELDDVPYQLAVDQAKADLDIAIAANRDQERSIRAQQANVAIADEQVSRAQSNLNLADQTLKRLLPMKDGGYVSAQQIDDAKTARQNATISFNEALKQRDAAEALVSETEGSISLVNARRAALAIAENELQNTRIVAPTDGHVVGMTTAEGNVVLPAQSLFVLIDTTRWYVDANYIETVLPGIEEGDCATVYALSDRERAIRGRVEGIGWGIASKDLIELPTSLPIVPKSLDWVKVQQRFPVRLLLEDPPPDLMRVGASALAIVHTDDSC